MDPTPVVRVQPQWYRVSAVSASIWVVPQRAAEWFHQLFPLFPLHNLLQAHLQNRYRGECHVMVILTNLPWFLEFSIDCSRLRLPCGLALALLSAGVGEL